MALSLLYTPSDYFSAHGDLLFTLLEDTKPFNSGTYPDYKYICDVYIYGFQQVRLKSMPRPNDKIGVFNIGNVVRNYLYPEFLPAPNSLRAQQMGENYFYTNVICRFGEEYGNTLYSNLIVDTQRSYFNHYNGRLIGQGTLLDGYLDKVMSIRPYATPVSRGASFCLIPFLPTDDTTINLVIRSYNGSTLVGTTTQPFTPTAASSNEMQIFNVSPAAINSAAPGFINNGVDYYTVTFSTTNIADDSVYRFDLVCEAKYEVKTIHFMNRFGGFESRDFTKVSRRSINVDRSSFGVNPYLITSDGQPHYYNTEYKVYRETNKQYASTWKEKLTLNTDFLTNGEYTWLEDLILAPVAYIEIDSYFYPMTITDTNYEPRKTVNDDLTNLTINIEFGDRFNTQYR